MYFFLSPKRFSLCPSVKRVPTSACVKWSSTSSSLSVCGCLSSAFHFQLCFLLLTHYLPTFRCFCSSCQHLGHFIVSVGIYYIWQSFSMRGIVLHTVSNLSSLFNMFKCTMCVWTCVCVFSFRFWPFLFVHVR